MACALGVAVAAAPALAASTSDVSALRGASCPSYQQTHQEPHSDAAVREALDGRFHILGKPVRLSRPVNWRMDPHDSFQWRRRLHNWVWIDPLLYGYSESGRVKALERAAGFALDWIKRNPPAVRGDAWRNKIAGDRAGYLSYIARAAGCEGILMRRQAAKLLDSIEQHGRYLADDRNHSLSNHGLFQDAGLILLTQYVPYLRQSDRWADQARPRLAASYRKRVNEEGVHLEHSPSYHFLVLRLLEDMIEFSKEPLRLDGLVPKMRAAGAWFVMPNGYLTQLGDTNLKVAPPWARRKASRQQGISPTRRAGYAIVRQPKSYLSVAAGHHSRTHKQADELTFELYEHGRRIVTDTGRWGHRGEPDSPNLAFTRKSQAHSVLVADGQGFDIPERRTYGSGIEATGGGQGWYAIEGVNPLLEAQRVRHRRIFIYRPGSALIVVDVVRSGKRHHYTRYFQLDPAIRVDPDGRRVGLAAGGFDGTLYDAPFPGERRTIVRGQRNPRLGLYSLGGFDGFQRRYAVAYKSRGSDVEHAATFDLDGGEPLRAEIISATRSVTKVRLLSLGGLLQRQLTVRRPDEHRLTVSETALLP